jgi:hypothetical protein
MKRKEKSVEMTWLLHFALKRKVTYIVSVMLAIISVTSGMHLEDGKLKELYKIDNTKEKRLKDYFIYA